MTGWTKLRDASSRCAGPTLHNLFDRAGVAAAAGLPMPRLGGAGRPKIGPFRSGDRGTATVAVQSGFDAFRAIRDAPAMGAAGAARLSRLAVGSAGYRNSPGPVSRPFRTPPLTPGSVRGDGLSCRGCPRR